MKQSQLAIPPPGTVEPRVKVAETSDQHTGRDSRLQASRRIDWRFLLPDPRLGRVAYCGPAKSSLAIALQQFSAGLTIFPLDRSAPVDPFGFEQIVVHSSNLADVDRANQLLLPGGYLYWEIDRTKGLVGLRHFRHYVNHLEQRGFGDIHVHWHRPNFEACLEIIPLDQPSALRYVFARPAGNLAGQLQMVAGRMLLKTALFARMVPCFSLVACKGLAGGL